MSSDLEKVVDKIQSHSVDMAELDYYKSKALAKKEGNPDLVGYLLAGAVAVAATTGVILAISPEARQSVMGLLGLAPKKEEKPVMVVQPPANPGSQETPGEPMGYHMTRDIGPARLSYRMAHSSTSYDRQTQEQLARDRAIVTQADLVKEQNLARWRRRNVSLSPPENLRLNYGSDGHGTTVQVDVPRSPKREWKVIKG